jgi:hypothetical protein
LQLIADGSRLNVIEAPPGSGKTRLVTHVAAWSASIGLSVLITGNTNAQVTAIANRFHSESEMPVFVLNSSSGGVRERDLVGVMSLTGPQAPEPGTCHVATSARAAYLNGRYDLVIADEAWQLSSLAFSAMRIGERYLLVGDPGQIAPIVQSDVSAFHVRRDHSVAAPDFLARTSLPISRLNLPSTHRLGAISAELIAPFYGFPFFSERTDRTVEVNGLTMPEIVVTEMSAPTSTDPEIMSAIAERAYALAEAGSVFVAVTHVDQVSQLQSIITHPNVTVSTFNRLQGLEADSVVTLDPLFDGLGKGERVGDLGRLCVGLSRHRAHLTFITHPALLSLLEETVHKPFACPMSATSLSVNAATRLSLKAFL